MSYSLILFAIDIGKVTKLVGSGDEPKLYRLISNMAERLEEMGDDSDLETLTNSLTLIVDGNFSDDQADYLYALEQICEDLGDRIDLPTFEDAHWSFFSEVGFIDEYLNETLPFPIRTEDSRYRIYFATRGRVAELSTAMDDHSLEHPDREIISARHELQEIVESVADDQLDLIGFYG